MTIIGQMRHLERAVIVLVHRALPLRRIVCWLS